MDLKEKKSFYCEKCNKTMDSSQFYNSNNTEKYPEGKLRQCKKCVSMHVDNFKPETYLWILQECDVPYIPDEWDKLLYRYAKDKAKLTGLTILGRYLAKMRLNQYGDYRWKDSEFLQEVANSKIKNTMERQGYTPQQIADAVNKASFELPAEVAIPEFADNRPAEPPPQDYFGEISGAAEEESELAAQLTDEDKSYLRLKWGKMYKPDEWLQLEKLYNEMMESYDIQTAAHIDTLKLICKTSLKCNQLIDIGDIESYQKMSRVYDSLMKSGKFTAAQNKAEQGEFVDSIGELVAICEKDGFIPRYYVDEPKDKVDETIKDMQLYTKTLIMEETNLGLLLENAINTVQKEDMAQETEENEEDDDDNSDIEEIEKELTESDFEEFDEFLEGEEINDALLADFLTQESDN